MSMTRTPARATPRRFGFVATNERVCAIVATKSEPSTNVTRHTVAERQTTPIHAEVTR